MQSKGFAFYSLKKHREAMSKEEQCKAPIKPKSSAEIKQRMKEYHGYCPKSKSNNIVFCPKKILKRKKEKEVQCINDYVKSFWGKGRKEKSKTKGKKKKKKKSKLNIIEHVKEIKEKINNIKDKFNIKLDDINVNVKHDIKIKFDDIS